MPSPFHPPSGKINKGIWVNSNTLQRITYQFLWTNNHFFPKMDFHQGGDWKSSDKDLKHHGSFWAWTACRVFWMYTQSHLGRASSQLIVPSSSYTICRPQMQSYQNDISDELQICVSKKLNDSLKFLWRVFVICSWDIFDPSEYPTSVELEVAQIPVV